MRPLPAVFVAMKGHGDTGDSSCHCLLVTLPCQLLLGSSCPSARGVTLGVPLPVSRTLPAPGGLCSDMGLRALHLQGTSAKN